MPSTADYLCLNDLPSAERYPAWCRRLAELGIVPKPDGPAAQDGTLTIARSKSGARIARLSAMAQRLANLRDHPVATAPYLLVLTLKGRGALRSGTYVQYFAQNDLAVFDQALGWTTTWTADFKAILLELPRPLLAARLGRQTPKLPLVLGKTVAADVVASMLGALGTQIEALSQSDLAVSETAIQGLLVSALMSETELGSTPLTEVQSGHMRRIIAVIDARITEPELSLADVARAERLSIRYVQRLFELRGDSFSRYLRQQRLDRCRAALSDPANRSRSVAEIAHGWGFGSMSYFSRAFREAFGVSPSDVRPHGETPPQGYAYRGSPGPDAPWDPAEAAPRPTSFAHPPARHTGSGWRPTLDDAAVDYLLPATAETVHWGYISRDIPPVLRVPSGAVVRIETLTQHGGDDWDRFVKGDPGAESVFAWTPEGKAVDRRGAGPMNASIFGRGAGEGFGVHICTGPIHVADAEPGDILEIEILDLAPRPCGNPEHAGKAFGSNASAWWGYQYDDLLDRPARHEAVTIYEVDLTKPDVAHAVYQYVWTPQTDPFGIVHRTMDYPGVPVDKGSVEKRTDLRHVEIPARPHFGFVGVAPRETEIVDSIPPGYFGGNIDNWRAGPGAKLYLPVAVPGALLSVGDGHFSQGDGEVDGTGLEMSLTGTLRLTLHKSGNVPPHLSGLGAPLIETETEWVVQSFSFENHLRDLAHNAQTEVYRRATVDLALRNAFRQTRRFLMEVYRLSEDEAHALMSVAVDFGVTQVADGNFGIHATIRKSLLQ